MEVDQNKEILKKLFKLCSFILSFLKQNINNINRQKQKIITMIENINASYFEIIKIKNNESFFHQVINHHCKVFDMITSIYNEDLYLFYLSRELDNFIIEYLNILFENKNILRIKDNKIDADNSTKTYNITNDVETNISEEKTINIESEKNKNIETITNEWPYPIEEKIEICINFVIKKNNSINFSDKTLDSMNILNNAKILFKLISLKEEISNLDISDLISYLFECSKTLFSLSEVTYIEEYNYLLYDIVKQILKKSKKNNVFTIIEITLQILSKINELYAAKDEINTLTF